MRIMLLGGSGLVGQGVLQALREAADVRQIVLPLRRPLDTTDPRFESHILPDLRELHPDHPAMAGVDAGLDCIGVLPGLSEAAFRAVTLDLNLHLAQTFASANPHGVFAYVSGAGSDPASRLMPLRIKGEIERALRSLPIRTVLLRPGIVQPVDGVRSPHALRQVAYAAGAPAMDLARRLAPSTFTSTRAIGRAMLGAVRAGHAGTVVLENVDIERLGR